MTEPNPPRTGSFTEGRVIRMVVSNPPIRTEPRTERELLDWMVVRRKYLGSPLPDGFVPPPGIDISELLKKLPPTPTG